MDGEYMGVVMADTPDDDGKGGIAALQRRNRALEVALARLRSQQEVLASGISHDLRAPLRAIDGVALQMQKRLDAGDTEVDLAQPLARIRGAVGRMSVLLDSLIQHARASQAELRRQAVDMTLLVDWALMDLGAAHPGWAFEASVQPDLVAQGDERLLRQLLDKALDNCRRFSKPDSVTRIQVTGEHDGEGLHLRIADQGIGMALCDPLQPFAPFQRLHGQGQGAGDGMGLAIVETIVQRHGGRVEMHARPDEGATLYVFLPDQPADDASPG